jgi:cytoskeletal protein RodZ
MNRLLPLIAGVVLVAALTGAAVGWRFPFFGQRRASNQLNTAQNQSNTGTRVQRTNQPATRDQNRTPVQRAAQQNPQGLDANNAEAEAEADNVNPEAAGTTDQADVNQPVPALW